MGGKKQAQKKKQGQCKSKPGKCEGMCLLCRSLVISIIWGTAALIDPFGLKTAADLQSEAIFMRMIGGPWYESSAQDQITVVLIDDQYLEKTGEFWPMSYLQQDLLLNDILALKPRAVFIDLLYRHRHGEKEDVKQLAETIDIYQAADKPGQRNAIPIYVPWLIKDMDGTATCVDATYTQAASDPADLVLDNSVINEVAASQAGRAFIGWTGCGSRYPNFVGGNPNLKTPAFAMYDLYCQSETPRSPDCQAVVDKDYSGFSNPMVLRWGTGVSKLHYATLSKASVYCEQLSGSKRLGYMTAQFWSALGQSFSSSRERGKAERCTYTDTLHATWFLGASDELRQFQKDMIEDRYVFIGAQVDGVNDYMENPVNGKVPGVFLFSMALDNLMTLGSGYYKEMGGLFEGFVEIFTLFTITFAIGLFWLEYVKTCKPGKGKKRSLGSRYLETVVSISVFKLVLPISISLLIAWLMWSMGYAPMDWIGVSLLAFIANPVKFRDCSERLGIQGVCEKFFTIPGSNKKGRGA